MGKTFWESGQQERIGPGKKAEDGRQRMAMVSESLKRPGRGHNAAFSLTPREGRTQVIKREQR